MRFGSPSIHSPTWQPSRRFECAQQQARKQAEANTYHAPAAPWQKLSASLPSSFPSSSTSSTKSTDPFSIPPASPAKANREAARDLRLWLAGKKGASVIGTPDGLFSFFVQHPRHEAALVDSKGSCEDFLQSAPGIEIVNSATGAGAGAVSRGRVQSITRIKLATTPASPKLPVWMGNELPSTHRSIVAGKSIVVHQAANVHIDDDDDDDDDEDEEELDTKSTKSTKSSSVGSVGSFQRMHRRDGSNSSNSSRSSRGSSDVGATGAGAGAGARAGARVTEHMHFNSTCSDHLPRRPAARIMSWSSDVQIEEDEDADSYGVTGILLEYGAYSDVEAEDGVSTSGASDYDYDSQAEAQAAAGDNDDDDEDDTGDENGGGGGSERDADTTLIALDPAYLAAAGMNNDDYDDGASSSVAGAAVDARELALDMLSTSWPRMRKAPGMRERTISIGSKQPRPHLGAVVM